MTIETSASIEKLAMALGKFQAETHGVVRDATNPFLKNRYATLEAVIETARPALAKAGLAFLQAPGGMVGNLIELETMLMHGASGEWIRVVTMMPLQKPDPQGVGSAITYACRYALMAMLGLPPLDDDAEATKPHPKKQPQQMPPDLGYDPKASIVSGPYQALQELAQPRIAERLATPAASPSKKVYIENTIRLIEEIETAPKLLERMKEERKLVWPQYEIEPHDEDGQRLVKAYKDRMAVLEQSDEPEAVE
jgi:hypothetical protein